MLQIIRHPELYRDPVSAIRDLFGEEWPPPGDRRLVLIFPTQTLLEHWEEKLLPAFGSWGGVRFVLFDGFVRDLLQETRPDLSDLTPGGSILLLRLAVAELTQEGRIPYLAQAFPAVGFYATLRQEIGLLKRAGLDPASFGRLVRAADQPLQELAVVYARYQQLLSGRCLADGEEKYRLAVAESAKTIPWLQGKELVVVGFTDFTRQQEALIHNLGRQMKVTVVFDHGLAGRPGLSQPSLPSGEKAEELVCSRPPAEPATKATPLLLAHLQKNLWAGPPGTASPGPDGSVALLKVKGGSRHELVAVANEVKRLLTADPSLEPDEIAVITPYPVEEVYQILTAFGLPVTAQISGALAPEPAAQALLEPFRVILSDFEWAAMVKYLRWGGVYPPEQLYRVDPPATLADWETTLATIFSAEEEQGARSKALLAFLARIPPEATYGQFFQICRDWLDHPLLLDTFLPPSAAAAPFRQARFVQTSFLGKLRGLVQKGLDLTASPATAPPEVQLADFYLTLEAMLAQEFTAKPASWRSGVRVLTPTEGRGLSFRVSFVVGLNEGLVPRLTPSGWLLREETVLDSPLASLLPTSREQLRRERLLFTYLLRTAGEKLVLTCSSTNEEGEAVNPSSFWEDLTKLLPDGQEIAEVETENLIAPLCRPDSAALAMEVAAKVRDALARQRAGRARNGYLGPPEAEFLRAKLGGKPFGISALEEYITCPFLYFCRRWLQIDPLGEPEIIPTRLAEGRIAHLVLKEFFHRHRGEVLRRNALETYLSEIRVLVQTHYPQAETVKSMLQYNLLVLGRENLISLLTRVVQEEVAWGEKTGGRFLPRYFELGFGGLLHEADAGSTPQPLVLTAEDVPADELPAPAAQPPLKIWGKIDRVDTDGAGNFIVYDYKTGRLPSQEEILSGKRLQLPLYLLAVSRLFLPEGRPVGAAYYSLPQSTRGRGIWRAEAEALGIGSRHLLTDEEWAATLENAVTAALQSYHAILRGAFPFCPPKRCPDYCEFWAICRQGIWGRGDQDGAE
ncbi:MAG: hypothetical protein GX202_00990 [Firmicutes bacterium]|nr:hypothetical protein [Bacillota bacterium]